MSEEMFDEVREQIDWAKTRAHLGFEAFIEYSKDDAFTIIIENDPDTGERVSKLKLTKEPPADVKGYFRTAIVDIKHSFDMSLHAAAQTLGAKQFKANYPWADSAYGLDQIIARRQAKVATRLPEVLIDEIRRQKPYASNPAEPGAELLVRQTASMANDKHSIGLIVSAAITSFDMSFSGDTGKGGIISVACGKWDPAKKEIELARASGAGQVSHGYPNVEANIFFKHADFVGKIPAKAVVAAFAERAGMVLEGFKVACASVG